MLLGVGAGGTRGGVAWFKHVVWNSQKTSKKRTLLFLIIFSVLFSITHEYWTRPGVPTSTDMILWLTYYSGTLRTQSCSCCVLPAWDNYLLPVFHFMSFFFLSSCYDYLRTLSFVVIFLLINFPAFYFLNPWKKNLRMNSSAKAGMERQVIPGHCSLWSSGVLVSLYYRFKTFIAVFSLQKVDVYSAWQTKPGHLLPLPLAFDIWG